MNIEHAIDLFLSYLKVERSLSKHTIVAYGTDLKIFASYYLKLKADAESLKKVDAISANELREFLYSQSRSGLSARTLARRLASLRSFFLYLREEGAVSEAPSDGLISPTQIRSLPKNAQHHDMLLLLEAPDLTTVRGLRDRGILSLFYAAGLRVSELSELKLGRFDQARGRIQAVGKGNKERLVPIGELTQEHLREYLQARAKVVNQAGSGFLFCGPKGKSLTRQAVWKLVKKYCRLAGVSTKLHPHSLRHAFATELIAGGADLRSVQVLLGHSSITTTEIYTHLEISHIKLAHEKGHPRG